jgi:hypothetical protein
MGRHVHETFTCITNWMRQFQFIQDEKYLQAKEVSLIATDCCSPVASAPTNRLLAYMHNLLPRKHHK